MYYRCTKYHGIVNEYITIYSFFFFAFVIVVIVIIVIRYDNEIVNLFFYYPKNRYIVNQIVVNNIEG